MKSQKEEQGTKITVTQGNGSFLFDIDSIRDRARGHMEDGSVTSGYKADRSQVIAVLNDALATEIICVLRYKQHYFSAQGIDAKPVAEEFLQHAAEEQEHVNLIARRIVQLRGEPDFNPDGLVTRSHTAYAEGNSLVDMIKEDLVAERIAIETYSEITRWLGNDDPTSRRIIEQILQSEEEHADELVNLLGRIATVHE